ncbi:TIGR02679 family protein [Salinactinospora qingdaonensis]|uniref:TIGR02679 family protein n=1 Tax=Salinactinospora qingdaonensis TaxID=702744 RepID=A0ABP7G9A7_9ACTN
MTSDAVARFRRAPYKRLLNAARRSLERTGGDLTGSVGVTKPDEEERNAIIGITGRYRAPDVKRATVALQELDTAVRGSCGLSLIALLEEIGPPLANRPERAAREAKARRQSLEAAYTSPLHESAGWYRDWLAGLDRDGTVTRLLRRGDGALIARAVAVLEFLQSRPADRAPIMLPALAAEVTHDTKALNDDTPLAGLVVRALALHAGVPRPGNAQELRELWDRFDVVVDDLASRVLVLNLAADGAGLGEWLTSAARTATPFYVTLHQLLTLPITLGHPMVRVCENPAILRRAAEELSAACPPLVCTEGRPSTAFRRLAHAVTAGGGRLRYHGDFDWPGIAIATDLIDRHGAEPWRMSAADYLAGLGAGEQQVALTGTALPTPWDRGLSAAMQQHGRAVYEEAVGGSLIDDLGG